MNSVTKPIPDSIVISDIPSITPTENSSNQNVFSKTITYGRIFNFVMILLLISFLGVNLFNAAGNFSDFLNKLVEPFMKLFYYLIGRPVLAVGKQIGESSVRGTRVAVENTSDVVSGGLKEIEKRLDTNADAANGVSEISAKNFIPEADTVDVKQRVSSGKKGYCYLGTDRGYRSCVEVNEADTCMSGDIFPTMDVCINPSLRA